MRLQETTKSGKSLFKFCFPYYFRWAGFLYRGIIR